MRNGCCIESVHGIKYVCRIVNTFRIFKIKGTINGFWIECAFGKVSVFWIQYGFRTLNTFRVFRGKRMKIDYWIESVFVIEYVNRKV